jgi:hypothetical protein
MDTSSDVFDALRAIMLKHADGLVVTTTSPTDISVEGSAPGPGGKPRWYGAVMTKKRYVSYHLMPVYDHPDLLDDISADLRARMQGKSCFNFTGIDDDLFRQLDTLTQQGFDRFGR